MALGRQRDRQAEMLVAWSELPRSPRRVFYDRLQAILIAAGFLTGSRPRHCRTIETAADVYREAHSSWQIDMGQSSLSWSFRRALVWTGGGDRGHPLAC